MPPLEKFENSPEYIKANQEYKDRVIREKNYKSCCDCEHMILNTRAKPEDGWCGAPVPYWAGVLKTAGSSLRELPVNHRAPDCKAFEKRAGEE